MDSISTTCAQNILLPAVAARSTKTEEIPRLRNIEGPALWKTWEREGLGFAFAPNPKSSRAFPSASLFAYFLRTFLLRWCSSPSLWLLCSFSIHSHATLHFRPPSLSGAVLCVVVCLSVVCVCVCVYWVSIATFYLTTLAWCSVSALPFHALTQRASPARFSFPVLRCSFRGRLRNLFRTESREVLDQGFWIGVTSCEAFRVLKLTGLKLRAQ